MCVLYAIYLWICGFLSYCLAHNFLANCAAHAIIIVETRGGSCCRCCSCGCVVWGLDHSAGLSSLLGADLALVVEALVSLRKIPALRLTLDLAAHLLVVTAGQTLGAIGGLTVPVVDGLADDIIRSLRS